MHITQQSTAHLHKKAFLGLIIIGITVAVLCAASNSQPTSAQAYEAAWTLDAPCTACHTIQTDSMDNKDCLLAIHTKMPAPVIDADSDKEDAEKPSQSQSSQSGASSATTESAKTKLDTDAEKTQFITCTTCHNDEKGLAKRHEKIDLARLEKLTYLKKTGIDEAACMVCHGTYEDLAEKTKDSTVLTDNEGTVINPHEMPGLTASHNDSDCSNCHKMHSKTDLKKDAQNYCTTCHHENVYECNTCH
ncbi:MAG: cytochrome c3 family protein [Coriobacteriales bacterium]|nr:cytochrome c3 family protein [Coriobacteriales bacterium]